MANPFGWDYPAGVTDAMISGTAADAPWEALFDALPDTCPKCQQSVYGTGEHGLAPHVSVLGADSCSPEIQCDFTPDADDADPCEHTLVEAARCGCPECKGEDF